MNTCNTDRIKFSIIGKTAHQKMRAVTKDDGRLMRLTLMQMHPIQREVTRLLKSSGMKRFDEKETKGTKDCH